MYKSKRKHFDNGVFILGGVSGDKNDNTYVHSNNFIE